MNSKNAVPKSESIPFPFYSIRNISCPDDIDSDRRVLMGHAPASSFLSLEDDENIRSYLVDAVGKKRSTPTQVHRQIRDTLENKPQDFPILNGGIVVVARDIEIDEKTRVAHLFRPSIINGSQTQGELRQHYARVKKSGMEGTPIFTTFEIIVTDDDDLIAEISISRNFQNDVASLSIVGRRGMLDELQESLQKSAPDQKIRRSESERSEDFLDTEKLLQVIAALTPPELWPKQKETSDPNKAYTYSMKARCLKDFESLYREAKDPDEPGHERALKLYEFYLEVAPSAWKLYGKWKTHNGFIGTRIMSIERDKNGRIINVPDGIVFPIIASLSHFAKKTRNGWRVAVPREFDEEALIDFARSIYRDVANANPSSMGKSRACFSQLFMFAAVLKRVADAA